MLTRLRHDAFICRDNEQGEIDAAGAGKHCPHESLVTRHIYDADCSYAVDHQRGESKIDCDAPTLFFGKPVRIYAGEGKDERRLAMIDVAGSSQDHAAVQAPYSQTRNARSSRSVPMCSWKNSRSSR